MKTPNKNKKTEQLENYHVDDHDQMMTTNDGVPVADNNNTLKAGDRGPSLMEDFIFREKLAHFDRERIPERVVHARGTGAHGVFECFEDMSAYTTADFLSKKGKTTPVFVRFSTVAGFRGSTDLARDVRGFSVKFYTDEGNYDLIGNNIPVFFIQDSMNFPDLVHAVKPEPHHEMPQAASAHNTFWDFVSLMPEAAHMIMWTMSDRAIPRSFRMMQGFGVHTFKFINKEGKIHFVKFHFKPLLGVHSVSWNEAQRISGYNSDFHRQDLYDNIEKGNFPAWDFGVQIVAEEDEHKFSFDLLDPTKIIPEELVPVKVIGRMTLNRNVDNFFAETEQAAFHPGRLVPGIDVTDDPLLQGRLFSYADTQIHRLGTVNHHQFPINRSVNEVHNNQRDGFAQSQIPKGNVSYFPNSLGQGCPYHAMMKGEQAGFQSHAEKIAAHKVRARSESFSDHFTQAALFYHSQSPAEQLHMKNAYSFELSKVDRVEVRKRYLSILGQIDMDLAQFVGKNLGLEVPTELDEATIKFARHNHPNYPIKAPKPEIIKSAALSMRVKLGEGSIATRKVAFLVADGVDAAAVEKMQKALVTEAAEAVLIAPHVGQIKLSNGKMQDITHSLLTDTSVLYDAVYVPNGDSLKTLSSIPEFILFINEAYKHCKVIAFEKNAESILKHKEINVEVDEGVILASQNEFVNRFIEVMKQHRVWERESERKNPA